MIDIIFILLSFFIASQIFSQWETEIDVKLPTAQTGTTPERLPGEIIINILKSGELVINGKTYTDESLMSLLDRIVEIWPGQPVLIRADTETSYGHVIAVLDLCRKADIWNISFATTAAD
ncbi:MAG: biopolymer transporter ExbD [Lentisphaerae bacterium]|nr:biopolymer transporter ExbD [Lentisphaerota bacterium]